MRTKELRLSVYEYDTILDLPESDQELIQQARNVVKDAYAPYSGFHVGAALLLADGKIIKGNNQENAALPTGLCAERVALFYAHANYPHVPVKAAAISASDKKGLIDDPITPCGSCRQAFIESEIRFKTPIRLILDGKRKILVFDNVTTLLPFAFKPESLG